MILNLKNCQIPHKNMAMVNLLNVLLFALFTAPMSWAAGNSHESEFLLMPTIHFEYRPDLDANSELESFEIEPSLNVFYSKRRNSLLFLSDTFITEDEFEFERLMAGLSINPESTIWFGRFHNPVGFWNTKYHHGAYLQTAVHRPAIAEYEDHGGILPTHLTGFLMDTAIPLGDGLIDLSFAAGAGPELDDQDGLESFELFSPNEGTHKLSTSFRLSYKFDELSANELGLFIGQSVIPVSDPVLNFEIAQQVTGAYLHWDWMDKSITTTVFHVANDFSTSSAKEDGSFLNAYIHGEYGLSAKWLLYGRLEHNNAHDDAYLEYFHHFIRHREVAGIRFDYLPGQAISFEMSREKSHDDGHSHISVHWSAVYP